MLTLDIDGVNQEYPEDNEPEFTWGAVSSACISAMVDAITARVRLTTDQSVAGNKTFTDSIILSLLKSSTTNPASAGLMRLAKTDLIEWRNNANGGNLPLGLATSDRIQFNSNDLKYAQALTTSTAGVTLTSASTDEHYVIPSADATYKLDNSFSAGSIRIIFNESTTKVLTITANDNAIITKLIPLSWVKVMNPSGSPSTNTSWKQLDAGGGWSVSPTVAGDFSAGYGDVTVNKIYNRREGPDLRIKGLITTGIAGAATMVYTLPYGFSLAIAALTTNKSKLGLSNRLFVSSSQPIFASSLHVGVYFYNGTATKVQYTTNTNAGVFESLNGTSMFSDLEQMDFDMLLPISGWEIG